MSQKNNPEKQYIKERNQILKDKRKSEKLFNKLLYNITKKYLNKHALYKEGDIVFKKSDNTELEIISVDIGIDINNKIVICYLCQNDFGFLCFDENELKKYL